MSARSYPCPGLNNGLECSKKAESLAHRGPVPMHKNRKDYVNISTVSTKVKPDFPLAFHMVCPR